jgi:putative hemolysin
MPVVLEIAVLVLLILLNGWFAMSEMAILSSRRSRLAARAADGSKAAKTAMALAGNPGRFLSTVQIGITLIGVLAGAYSGATLVGTVAAWIATVPFLAPFSEGLSIACVVGAITLASLVFGELVPKQIALANPEDVAVLVARPMARIARLAWPLLWVLEMASRITLKLLGVHRASNRAVTEEEVREIIAEGAEAGILKPEEKELISGVMRFGDRKIRAIMTPRNEVTWIDLDANADVILATIRQSEHSCFPVYKGSPDQVVGVVRTKDLLDAFLAGGDIDIGSVLRPVSRVQDGAPALTVLDVLKQSPEPMVLAVDRNGDVEGIVTPSDILSVIAGSLTEEGAADEAAFVQREDGSWLVDGDAAADETAERIGCKVMRKEEGDFVTVAGFILAKSRRVPAVGERFDWEGWRFEVVDMDGRRIDKVMISRKPALE